MATPPRKYPYNVYYNDGSFMTYEMTREDYDQVESNILGQSHAVKISIGILSLVDIRAIVEQKVEKSKKEKPEKPANPIMDEESELWMKEHLSKIWEGVEQ